MSRLLWPFPKFDSSAPHDDSAKTRSQVRRLGHATHPTPHCCLLGSNKHRLCSPLVQLEFVTSGAAFLCAIRSTFLPCLNFEMVSTCHTCAACMGVICASPAPLGVCPCLCVFVATQNYCGRLEYCAPRPQALALCLSQHRHLPTPL
jgi:hypothetical protein